MEGVVHQIGDVEHLFFFHAARRDGGIRVGTPAVTTRGMKEEEMLDIADLMNDALQNRDDANVLEGIRGKVRELTRKFPLPS